MRFSDRGKIAVRVVCRLSVLFLTDFGIFWFFFFNTISGMEGYRIADRRKGMVSERTDPHPSLCLGLTVTDRGVGGNRSGTKGGK